jgi:hypothetical protein
MARTSSPSGAEINTPSHFNLPTSLVEPKLAGLLSIEGMEGSDSINNRCAVRGGLQLQLGDWLWDFGGSLGLASKSEDWGLRTGLTIPFDLPSNW